MTLGRSSDRRIARHVGDRFTGQRAQTHMRAKSRGRICGLNARMTRADDDDVEAIFHRVTLLFPDTEPREDMREQIIRRPSSGNFFERAACVLQIGENRSCERLMDWMYDYDTGKDRAPNSLLAS